MATIVTNAMMRWDLRRVWAVWLEDGRLFDILERSVEVGCKAILCVCHLCLVCVNVCVSVSIFFFEAQAAGIS